MTPYLSLGRPAKQQGKGLDRRGTKGEEQEGKVRAIDLVVAGQDTGRDGRRSNRNGEVTTSTGKTIGKRRDMIGTTRRETAGGKHKGFILRG